MKNISIREATKNDIEGIYEMILAGMDRGTWKYTSRIDYPKTVIENSFDEKNPKGSKFIVAINKNNDKIVGDCVYFYDRKKNRFDHRVVFGWCVHPDYEGCGIVTRLIKSALKDAKLNGYKKAEAEICELNIASCKAAEKCGFNIEGEKRNSIRLDDGTFANTFIYGKLL